MARNSNSSHHRNAEHYLIKAKAFRTDGKLKEAIKELHKGYKAHSNNLPLCLQLSAIEFSSGNTKAAIRVLEKTLAMHPGQPDVLYHLGFAYLAGGNAKKAQSYLDTVVTCHPNFVPAGEALGLSFLLQGKYAEALDVFQAAMEAASDGKPPLSLCLHIVTALRNLSRMEEAFEVLAKAKQDAPNDVQVLLAEANLHADLGNTLETTAYLQQILQSSPDHIEAFVMLQKIRTREPDSNALERIEKFLSDATLSRNDRITLQFLAGEILDQSREFDAAFRHFETANKLQREKNGPFDMRSHFRLVEEQKAVFDQRSISRLGDLGSDSKRPIFILGMPRSGTSLVEQILASHPDVHGGGERKEIPEIADDLAVRLGSDRTYPKCILDLNEELTKEIAEEYLDRVSAGVAPALRITDKMPGNFLNIGLIRLLFPEARIIHCIRDPMDTCLSCFMNNFGSRLSFSNSLADVAEYFRAYQDLMGHWNAVLDPPIFHLRYEKLVADPDAEIRNLINYCNLPWDERCMTPHLASRRVITASRWQVRRPIYQTGVSRAGNYASHLGDLRNRLDAVPISARASVNIEH